MHRGVDAARVLGLPEGYAVANTIAFGYPVQARNDRLSRPRRPLGDYVHFERW